MSNKKLSFSSKVLEVVRSIPRGKTMSYQEVARLAGSPLAFRVVGSIMKKNFLADVPCHRVIKSDGSVGEYNRGGPTAKMKLIDRERLV